MAYQDEVLKFINYRKTAVQMFPVLKQNPDVEDFGDSNAEFKGFNVGGVPMYNLPAGYDVDSNQSVYLVVFHESGHEYGAFLDKLDPTLAHRDSFLSFIGVHAKWADLVAANTPYVWANDPGEWWAQAFANAVAGQIVVDKDHTVNALSTRAFFLSFLPQPAPQPVPVPSPAPTPAPSNLRLCYDSITAKDIPADAKVVAGYVDGIYKWTDEDWARFQNAVKVRIAVSASTNDGHVLDVETGDAYPWQAPSWVQTRRAAGIDPTCYVNWSNYKATVDAFTKAGVDQPHYWLASYDDDPTIPDGFVAKQYANSTLTGGHYDVSNVLPVWPGVDGGEEMPSMDEIMAELDKRYDITNTFKAIKDRLAVDAHHQHQSVEGIGFKTSEPLEK